VFADGKQMGKDHRNGSFKFSFTKLLLQFGAMVFSKKMGQSINPQYDTISRYYTNTGKLAFAGLAIGFF
jgi:hypothetical protein